MGPTLQLLRSAGFCDPLTVGEYDSKQLVSFVNVQNIKQPQMFWGDFGKTVHLYPSSLYWGLRENGCTVYISNSSYLSQNASFNSISMIMGERVNMSLSLRLETVPWGKL